MLIDLLNNDISQDEYLTNNNARIIYKKLPKKIYGFLNNYKNINVIVINWNISREKKKKTIIHECAHLELNHLQRKKELLAFSIDGIEDEADRYVDFLLKNVKGENNENK